MILGAIITTLSTVLLLVTTAFTHDVIQGWLRPEMTDHRAGWLARGLTVVVVALVAFMATFNLQIIVLLQAVTFVTLGLTFFRPHRRLLLACRQQVRGRRGDPHNGDRGTRPELGSGNPHR